MTSNSGLGLKRRPWTRADSIAITLVTAVAGAIRGYHLSLPARIYGDELFYARDGCLYVFESREICGIPTDAVSPHPPLGKWLISLGIQAFGWEPFGWRIASLIAGTACVALLYLLARRLLGSTKGATFAASLLAIDFLHFAHSRFAMVDIILALFVLASFLFVVIDRDRYPDRAVGAGERNLKMFSRPWLLAAGLAAGAAIATKWVGLGSLAGVAVLSLVWTLTRPSPENAYQKLQGTLKQDWLAMVLALIIAPSLVYVLSYTPRLEGSIFTLPWQRGSWTRNFARQQREMLHFHLSSSEIYYVGKTNRDVSPAWSWLLIKRPEHYYFHETGNEHGRIMGMGSPLVWWTSLAALAYLALQIAQRRCNDAAIVAVTAIGVLYLPFVFVSSVRAAPFLHDILPSVPFMCLAVATVADGWTSPFSKWIIFGFLTAAVGLFIFFYPVLSGLPLSLEALQARQWFQDCQPGPGMAAPGGWCWE